MSAFLVSEKHISVLVGAWMAVPDFDQPQLPPAWRHDQATELGRRLLRENMLSLEARYGDGPSPVDEPALDAFRYDLHACDGLSIVAKIKAIHCYMYQACEHDGWETSDARAFCKSLESALVHQLPGYDAAPWGI